MSAIRQKKRLYYRGAARLRRPFRVKSAPTMPCDLPKNYAADAIEKQWRDRWEQAGCFDSTPRRGRESFSIVLPPPNVTGSLHMGHAFQHTLMDALARRARMLGKNTLWQPGTDHAGIATQMVVARELEKEGIDPAALSREQFIARAWEWKERSGSTITSQMRRLAASCDWSRERFTMDEGLSKIVVEVFVRLHEEGLIYRGPRMVNWDPVLLTAVSDLEVVSEEEDGAMFYVRYPFVGDEENGIVIGTTRPETILVDGAIAVHPDDARFHPLLGRKVWVPLTDPARAIEIIADPHVDPAFGSGCVKITAAHDFNDHEVYLRHPDKNIPLIVLLTPDAKMNDNAPRAYRGLDRYVARERIVADLSRAGLLIKKEPHRYKLPRGDRSGAVVEPMLTEQWFVRAAPLAEKALAAARSGELRFVPGNWRGVYEQWLANIKDWCVSRQLVWGHQIPAWRDEEGNFFVARDEEEARRKAGDERPLTRDPDVLDTWFSSALWPFSTLGWPREDDPHFRAYFPTSVLVTGFDIIFFWVARMVMASEHFLGCAPFREVYVTGLVRDSEGRKMSKSKGNILDPLDLVDGIDLDALVKKRTDGLADSKRKESIARATRREFPDGVPSYGADALRLTFCALASHGRDIKFDRERCGGWRNFCNKLWHAARFVLAECADRESGAGAGERGFADDWIVSRLQKTEAAVARAFDDYRFDLAAERLHHFVWDEFCDWHLECAKVRLRDPATRRATQDCLLSVFEATLRLLHPLAPFVTEELWRRIAPAAGKKETAFLALARYPIADESKIDERAEAKMRKMRAIVESLRALRAQIGIAPRDKPSAVVVGADDDLPETAATIRALARVGDISAAAAIESGWPTAAAGDCKVALLARADSALERARAQKEATELESEIARARAKLENADFVARAPESVVAQQKERLARAQSRLHEIRGDG